ncbi:G1/S-specific cyclin-E1 [Dimargaris verticillata]|uniref:G1/S-specific cyclin-E1 n=1 Tax=Dimargaris verticillata TaxID=2761393 RepID=A0A9W8BBC4_9FUNG|nr:G1/S-specific cyclin-E1 [Dimargaris verticillata]
MSHPQEQCTTSQPAGPPTAVFPSNWVPTNDNGKPATALERVTLRLFKRKTCDHDATTGSLSHTSSVSVPTTALPDSPLGPRRHHLRHLSGTIESWVTQRIGVDASRQRVPSTWAQHLGIGAPGSMARRSTSRQCSWTARHHGSASVKTDRRRPGGRPSALTLFKGGNPWSTDAALSECPSPKRLCTPDQETFTRPCILSGSTVVDSGASSTSQLENSPSPITLQVLPSSPLASPATSCHSDVSTETLLSCESSSRVSSPSEAGSPAPSPRAALFDDLEGMCYENMVAHEPLYRASRQYLHNHRDLNAYMRPILVDWLLEVGADFHLHRATIHTAVNYLDRFLGSCQHVTRDILQCLATACLSIAMKLEEYSYPKLKELVDLAQGAFDLAQLKRAEHIVLKGLKWRLNPTTVPQWLTLYFYRATRTVPHLLQRRPATPPLPSAISDPTKRQSYQPTTSPLAQALPQFHDQWYTYAMDIADVVLHDPRCLDYSYATMAASCLYLAFQRMAPDAATQDIVSEGFEQWTGMPLDAVDNCVAFLTSSCMAVSALVLAPALGDAANDSGSTAQYSKARFGPNYHRYHKDDPHTYQSHHPYWLPVIQRVMRDSYRDQGDGAPLFG